MLVGPEKYTLDHKCKPSQVFMVMVHKKEEGEEEDITRMDLNDHV